jgi:hypothetical protein
MQTKTHSIIEQVTNIIIGYIVALISQLVIFPFFDIDIPLKSNLYIGAWFTAVSFCRGYILRRWFTKRTE